MLRGLPSGTNAAARSGTYLHDDAFASRCMTLPPSLPTPSFFKEESGGRADDDQLRAWKGHEFVTGSASVAERDALVPGVVWHLRHGASALEDPPSVPLNSSRAEVGS